MKNANFRLIGNCKTDGAAQPNEIIVREKVERMKDAALALLRDAQQLNQDSTVDVRRGVDYYEEVRRYESNLIKRALAETNNHQVRAARILGMKVTTLNSMIKRYKISLDESANDASAPEEP